MSHPRPPPSLPAVSSGLFSRGPVELVHHAMTRAHTHMAQELSSASPAHASLALNARLIAGVMARLSFLAQWRRSWPQAMALGAAPFALPETLRLLGTAADEVWWAAGDRSVDAPSWYTRRALLITATAASELHMLTDDSPALAETRAALSRHLDEAQALSAVVSEGSSVISEAARGAGTILAAAFDLTRPSVGASATRRKDSI